MTTNDDVKDLSVSAKLFRYLETKGKGHTFTKNELQRDAGKYYEQKLTEGAVSGFLNRAEAKGVITEHEATRIDGNYKVYRVVDLSNPWEFKKPGIGSIAGRAVTQARRPVPRSLSETLLTLASVAEELEKKSKTLADYTETELLAELQRRAKRNKAQADAQ